MNRLDFVLPDFTRTSWNNLDIRKIWEPRITKIKDAWSRVELMRESSIHFIIPELLPDFVIAANVLDKVVVPLAKEGIGNSYSSTSSPIIGRRFQFRVAVTESSKVKEWLKAWEEKDEGAIGHLLGYPSCCIDFFLKYWIDQKFVDTSWCMVENDAKRWMIEKLEKEVQYNVAPENNILLRWLGLRLVSHLPCSFNCEETKKIAEKNKENFRKLNYHDELEWLMELLSHPVEWSAKNGIAEIVTPLLRIATRTDATGEKYSVKLSGTEIRSKPVIINDWTDNGFSSKEAQEKAHKDLLTVSAISEGKILDLGCGNGKLLWELNTHSPVGVDFSIAKINKARQLLPYGEFYSSSIYEFFWLSSAPFDYVFIAGNRLHENPASGTLVRKLKETTKYVVLYTYDNQDINEFYKKYFSDWKISRGSLNVLVLNHD